MKKIKISQHRPSYRYYVFKKKYFNKLLGMLLIIVMCLLGFILVPKCSTDSKSGMDIIDIITLELALLSAYTIFFQLRDHKRIKKIALLYEINSSFYNQADIMPLYNYFESCYRCIMKNKINCKDCLYHDENYFCTKISNRADFNSFYFSMAIRVKYCTIFSILYNATEERLIDPYDLYELFLYRFFIMTCNPWMQKVELNAENIEESYQEIFSLYKLLTNLSYKGNINNYANWITFNELHDSNKKELPTNSNPWHIKSCQPIKISDILELEKLSSPKEGEKIYIPFASGELEESGNNNDYTFTIVHDDRLIAYALVIRPRECSRNLYTYIKNSVPTEVATLDAIFVHPDFRGYGLQRKLINHIIDKLKEDKVKYIAALVSPCNNYSLNNFTTCQFKKVKRINKDGYERYVIKRDCFKECKK